MTKYIIRRLIISIPVLFGITVIVFLLIHFAPGDPVMGMIDPTQGGFSAELIERERARLGLDQPLPVQYVMWLGRVLRGDLGYSLITRKPVAKLIGERIWPTVQLTMSALLLSIIVGITIGIISAVKQYSWIDYLTTLFSFAAVSVPGFFLALGLIFILALKLQWLPTSGMQTLGQPFSVGDRLKHMIMPVIVLSVSITAPLVRYARSSMLDVLRQDYVNAARAKGLREWVVILRHALPNALIPLVTVIGLRLPALFEGSVIVEQIFHWQGMGSLNIWAVLNQDYTTLMGLNMFTAILVLGANLLTDIAYAIVDPRIKYE
ncbi:MAG: ABC transporter permease [Anaerolineae bacterium]|nr:ABC transporter permease [Anaerolineae bacterium]